MDTLIMTIIKSLEHLQDTMQSRVFLRGLSGIVILIRPLIQGDEVPPTWKDAVLQYERAFPYPATFYTTFSLAEQDKYEKLYTLMAAENDTIQANQQKFLSIVEQFVV